MARQVHKKLKFKYTAIWGGRYYAKIVIRGVYYRRNGSWRTEEDAAAYANALNNHYRPGKEKRNDVDPALDSAAAKLLIDDLAAGLIKTGQIKTDANNFSAIKTFLTINDPESGLTALEGEFYFAERKFRQRNSKLIAAKKKQSNGRCSVCGIKFSEQYSGISRDCLVAHHVKPIGNRQEATETTLNDIDLLCPNCHSAVHTQNPPLTAAQLRKMLHPA